MDDVDEATSVFPLTLHPNPTTDQVVIELEQDGDFVFSIYDTNGKLILSERNVTTVSFKNRPAGLYNIVVEQNGQRWSRKLIKM